MAEILVEYHHWTPQQVGAMTLPQIRIFAGNVVGDAPAPRTVKMTKEELAEWQESRKAPK